MVVSILMSVLLPAPLGPMRPKISPELTVKEASDTAATLPNRRQRLNVSTTAELTRARSGTGVRSGIVIHRLIAGRGVNRQSRFSDR